MKCNVYIVSSLPGHALSIKLDIIKVMDAERDIVCMIWSETHYDASSVLEDFRSSHRRTTSGIYMISQEFYDEVVEKVLLADLFLRDGEGSFISTDSFVDLYGPIPFEVTLPDGWVELKRSISNGLPH
jgi:hypothetical protein